ncbi:MAG: hypothetical protein PWP23_1300 [Candidatus Sumerlaeota bacterium]|nr:hypothetical protein [Candidatus Sumerlaeota bacterium]
MILYVETNFLLEIARQQDHAQEAEELLLLGSDRSRLRLFCPAHCIGEAAANIGYHHQERLPLLVSLQKQQRELGRYAIESGLTDLIGKLDSRMHAVRKHEEWRLEQTVEKLLRFDGALPTPYLACGDAAEFELEYELRFSDALLLATVIRHARTLSEELKAFVSRDRKDFGGRVAREVLRRENIKYLTTFEAALALAKRHRGEPGKSD